MNTEKVINSLIRQTKNKCNSFVPEDIFRESKVNSKNKTTINLKLYVPDKQRTDIVQSLKLNSLKHNDIYSSGKVIGKRINLKDDTQINFFLKPKRNSGIKNTGDTAEGVLGVAFMAKILNKKAFNSAKVYALLNQLSNQKDLSDNPLISNRKLKKNNVSLDIRMAKVNFSDLLNANNRNSLKSVVEASVAYIQNDKDTILGIDRIGLKDKISINCDGFGEQRTSKVDVRILKNGREVPYGKISLKTNSSRQLMQIGKQWNMIYDFFDMYFGIKLNETQKKFWEKSVASKDRQGIMKATTKLYSDIVELSRGKRNLKKHFISGLTYSMSLYEKNVRIVHLKNGKFKTMKLDRLEDIFSSVPIKLRLESKNRIAPKLIVYDSKLNVPLISIRPKVETESFTIRHYVEKEQRLVELLSTEGN